MGLRLTFLRVPGFAAKVSTYFCFYDGSFESNVVKGGGRKFLIKVLSIGKHI